ncbi:hypothetical protein OK016_12865 [Vibrio chagasii]|nr:hypothetical protein [Vibrio chagasii]
MSNPVRAEPEAGDGSDRLAWATFSSCGYLGEQLINHLGTRAIHLKDEAANLAANCPAIRNSKPEIAGAADANLAGCWYLNLLQVHLPDGPAPNFNSLQVSTGVVEQDEGDFARSMAAMSPCHRRSCCMHTTSVGHLKLNKFVLA